MSRIDNIKAYKQRMDEKERKYREETLPQMIADMEQMIKGELADRIIELMDTVNACVEAGIYTEGIDPEEFGESFYFSPNPIDGCQIALRHNDLINGVYLYQDSSGEVGIHKDACMSAEDYKAKLLKITSNFTAFEQHFYAYVDSIIAEDQTLSEDTKSILDEYLLGDESEEMDR